MPNMSKNHILIIPGWNGSGPTHWQTYWEKEFEGARRLLQKDWAHPLLKDWLTAMQVEIMRAQEPVVLVAHSLGCILVAHWASFSGLTNKVKGALLVAPPWLNGYAACPADLESFLPIPSDILPFFSCLIASENDPYMPFDRARKLATLWGARFVNAGSVGHINAESGHGDWPQGKALLEDLLSSDLAALQGSSVRNGNGNEEVPKPVRFRF
jgi:uncharacterized protein